MRKESLLMLKNRALPSPMLSSLRSSKVPSLRKGLYVQSILAELIEEIILYLDGRKTLS
jgi:hypothetical protein